MTECALFNGRHIISHADRDEIFAFPESPRLYGCDAVVDNHMGSVGWNRFLFKTSVPVTVGIRSRLYPIQVGIGTQLSSLEQFHCSRIRRSFVTLRVFIMTSVRNLLVVCFIFIKEMRFSKK